MITKIKKNWKLVLFAFAILVVFTACGSGAKENQTKAVSSENKDSSTNSSDTSSAESENNVSNNNSNNNNNQSNNNNNNDNNQNNDDDDQDDDDDNDDNDNTTPPTVLGKWSKILAGNSDDMVTSVQLTADNGYIASGISNSFGTGGRDFDPLVLKIDSEGDVVFKKVFKWDHLNGKTLRYFSKALQTEDGGFIFGGSTIQYDSSYSNLILIKMNADNELEWNKVYGGGNEDKLVDIQITNDGGFLLAGYTMSFGAGKRDIWILKLDSTGTVLWQKTFGGENWDYGISIKQTSDGGYILIGQTNSYEEIDMLLLKLNADGSIAWKKGYGNGVIYNPHQIQATSDGGFIIVGEKYGSEIGGIADGFILKVGATGTVEWGKKIGSGLDWDILKTVKQTIDNNYIAVGSTEGSKYDIWALKIEASGTILWEKRYFSPGLSINEFGWDILEDSDHGLLMVSNIGSSYSDGTGDTDIGFIKMDSDGNIDETCHLEQATANHTVFELNINTYEDFAITETATNVVGEEISIIIEDPDLEELSDCSL